MQRSERCDPTWPDAMSRWRTWKVGSPGVRALLVPVVRGAAFQFPAEQAVEERQLSEAAVQGDLKHSAVAMMELVASGLEA